VVLFPCKVRIPRLLQDELMDPENKSVCGDQCMSLLISIIYIFFSFEVVLYLFQFWSRTWMKGKLSLENGMTGVQFFN